MLYKAAYTLPPCNTGEILRYAGAKDGVPEVAALMRECIAEASGCLTAGVCWREFPVSDAGELLDLGFVRTGSRDLRKNLQGCRSIVLFAATIGIGIDRLIARESRLSPAKALMLQAVGAERIEALCDLFNGEITEKKRAEGLYTRPRFSPGYGDLPLELQKDIFAVLDCPRQIGLTLNQSLLMSPSKSVTAIIGVGQDGGCVHAAGCAACGKTDCTFRRES